MTIISYKYYTKYDLWRCAAFGEYIKEKGYLLIKIIPCNPKDQFSKKRAKEIYSGQGYHKHTGVVRCEEKDSRKAFFDYMNKEYRKIHTITIKGEIIKQLPLQIKLSRPKSTQLTILI